MSPKDIRETLAARGLRPLKQLGQNFLHDQNLCNWLAEKTLEGFEDGQQVLELGPGLGALTKPLLERGARVMAIEKDRGLAAFLRETLGPHDRFVLIEGDALDAVKQLPTMPEVVAGNLPYNISTPLIMTLLEQGNAPKRMQFLLQMEMAERLSSKPGSKSYNALSVIVQAEQQVEILRRLKPAVFFPSPEVDSAAVRFTRLETPIIGQEHKQRFAKVVKQGFSQRRKKLSNVLPIKDERRAGALSVEDWAALFFQLVDASSKS